MFLTSGGSDAVDTAAKLARRYWHAVGRPEKLVLIGRRHAYHGMHAWGTSLGGIPANLEGMGTLVPDVVHVEPDSVEELAAAIDRVGSERVAAFIGEPVVGAGGVIPPPDGYWEGVAELCSKHDLLLVADEVITGFGRLGRWFGCERFGFTPDLLVFAKGVTSGYMPLGGVIVGPRVQEPFWSGDGISFRHGYTYSGHAAACAAALSNLDILERERLVERVNALEHVFAAKVHSLAEHPLVGDARDRPGWSGRARGGRARARPETGRARGDPRARARRTDPLAAGPRPTPLARVRDRARGDRCARGGIARGAGRDPGEKVGSTVTTCESDRLPDGTRVSRSPCGEEAEDA